MLRAVLFDFDGLILDTETPELAAWREVYGAHGAVLELDVWAVCIGTRDAFDPVAHLEGLIGRALDRPSLLASRRIRHRELIAGLLPLPGVEERLAEAKALG